MSQDPSDEKFLLNAAAAITKSCINNLIQSHLNEMNNANARQLKINNQKLQNKKNLLVERITSEMDSKGSNPQLEAILAQILNAPLNKIPLYEQCVDELGIVNRPQPRLNISNHFHSEIPMVMRPVMPSYHLTNALSLLMLDEISESKSQRQVPKVKEDEKKVCVTFKDLQREASNSTCTICMEKYEQNDEVEIRHCGHTFHKKCLISWETTGRSNGKLCPCCRK
jgi:hypothetical protein